MAGVVRDVEPVTIKDLWSRKCSLQHDIEIIRHTIIQHEEAIRDAHGKLEGKTYELRVISKAIKRLIAEGK